MQQRGNNAKRHAVTQMTITSDICFNQTMLQIEEHLTKKTQKKESCKSNGSIKNYDETKVRHTEQS